VGLQPGMDEQVLTDVCSGTTDLVRSHVKESWQ
jgi:hypothetical protein